MNSDDNVYWIPTIFVTFLALSIATTLYLFSKLPRKVIVSELNIYPIKSCGAMQVPSAEVTPNGFAYDRFAQASDSKGNFLTPRDEANARLFHVNPTVLKDETTSSIHLRLTYKDNSHEPFRLHDLSNEIKRSETIEATPIVGEKVKLKDLGDDVANWLSEVTEIEDCRLTAIGPDYQRFVTENPKQCEPIPLLNYSNEHVPSMSLADEAPFLLTTTASLNDLNARLAVRGRQNVGMQRFRPNIVVRGTYAWEEDTWKRIRIGNQEFQVWQRCGRCSMTTIDRKTLERGPEPLATLSTFRERSNGQRNFGMHLIPILPNANSKNTLDGSTRFQINSGDTLEVLEYDEKRLEEWKRLFGP